LKKIYIFNIFSFQNKNNKRKIKNAFEIINSTKNRNLSEKRESEPDFKKMEILEKLSFKLLFWGHLLAFTSQALFFFLKHIEYFSFAQIIQSIFVPICYIYFLPFIVFVVRSNFSLWDASNITIIRMWLLIEIMHYFNWLFSIGIFLGSSYAFRFKTISKDLDMLLEDDNVWNDKNTYDFLGVLKSECYYFSYKVSLLITNVQIGFILPYNISLYGEYYNSTSILLFTMIFVEALKDLICFGVDLVIGKQNITHINSIYTRIFFFFKIAVLIILFFFF
jgi:hypothetical protein